MHISGPLGKKSLPTCDSGTAEAAAQALMILHCVLLTALTRASKTLLLPLLWLPMTAT